MPALLSPSEALQRGFELAPAGAAVDTPHVESAQRRYGVSLGDYGLLLPRDQICEVTEGIPDCRLPNTPCWFAGVVNQRGNMVPVFDVAAMLGASIHTAPESRSWVLIVATREAAVGLKSGTLPETLQIAESDRLDYNPAAHSRLHRFVTATFNCDDRLWLEWDMDGFFTAVGESLSTA